MNVDARIGVESPPFPRYVRRGDCERCGACCLVEECEHLSINDEGLATCLIYNDADRPLKCKLYPANPPLNFETCGYYFIDLWENNREIKYGDELR
ncbi:unnamed protein product [marine sediment metagenome]|uniref:Uncharacterized protein n=1 Tax=marine sediment metagenome TaxID=412755 RepID=X1UIA6_9ZZZZ